MRRYARLFQREGFTLPPETMERLMRHRYPGNVRELENMIKRMIVLGDPLLTKSPLPGGAPNGDGDGARPGGQARRASRSRPISRKAAQAAEREAILKALEETQWNRLRAAKLLNISYRALLYKIKDAGLEPERRRLDRAMRDDLKRTSRRTRSPQKGAGLERLRAVWSRRKWLAILVFALPSPPRSSVILSLPNLYRSTATVLVERQQVPESLRAVHRDERARDAAADDQPGDPEPLAARGPDHPLRPLSRPARSRRRARKSSSGCARDIQLELKTTDAKGRPSATIAFAL